MSRSYKKHPIHQDHGRYTYIDKRNASKAVRNTKDVPDGGKYKCCFCSWDISDYYTGHYTWEEVWESVKDSQENMKAFYENVLHKSYDKKEKTEKELKREFWKRVSK